MSEDLSPTPSLPGEIRDQVEKIVRKWLPILGMEQYTVNINVDHYGIMDAVGGAVMQAGYDKVSLYINLDLVHSLHENPDLEELVLHELVHMLSPLLWSTLDLLSSLAAGGDSDVESALRDHTEHFMEQVTTRVTRALMIANGRPARTFGVHQTWNTPNE